MDFSINIKSPMVENELFIKAIHEHYPCLIIKSISFIPEGEDFYVFQVNNDLIFRFAKSEREVEKLKFEDTLLPKLINTLEVSIPHFTFKNFTDKDFSFVGYKKIEGIPFNVSGNSESVEYSAKTIGSVIAKLHEFRSQDTKEIEQQRKNWIAYFTGFIQKINEDALPNLSFEIRNSILEILSKKEATFVNYKFTPCPIHSDFKSSHILCDEQNKMIGLIDWGDSKKPTHKKIHS
jgi:aminoglycoside 2''-phosphotransferase